MVIVIGQRGQVGDACAKGHRHRPRLLEDRERWGMRKGASHWMEMGGVMDGKPGSGWPAERWWGWQRGGGASGE
jgi:hypothetical protein